MISSERQIDFGYSWFSAKFIEVECFLFFCLGKALINVGRSLISSFEISETINGKKKEKQSDFGCEGSKSKGKQSRL